jgi:putative oxidoreductase
MQIKSILTTKPFWMNEALAIIRILVGIFMIYHGKEIFEPETMKGYAQWDQIKALPFPDYIAYVGKGTEFFTGCLFVLGLFTRIAALVMAGNMLFISFVIANGKIFYEDQHPFLFALLALIFFFAGPVKWALDFLLFIDEK